MNKSYLQCIGLVVLLTNTCSLYSATGSVLVDEGRSSLRRSSGLRRSSELRRSHESLSIFPTISSFSLRFFSECTEYFKPVNLQPFSAYDHAFLDSETFIQAMNEMRTILEKNRAQNIPYIQRVDVNPETKIISIGDIHGSAHALVKNLQDLRDKEQLLDDNWRLKPNVILIMLGDYINRGHYSIETLYIISQLKKANPTTFFAIKGNHETPGVAQQKRGFEAEITHKYGPEKYGAVIGAALQLFSYLPTALCIGDENYIFACHGGFPVDGDVQPRFSFDRTVYTLLARIAKIAKFDILLVTSDPKNCDPEVNDFLYGGFWANPIGTAPKADPRVLFFPANMFSQITDAISEGKIKAILKAHQHNGNAVCTVSDTEHFNKVPARIEHKIAEFSGGSKGYPIFIHMSAPNGLGMGVRTAAPGYGERDCNVRGYSVITVGKTWPEWTIRAVESPALE